MSKCQSKLLNIVKFEEYKGFKLIDFNLSKEIVNQLFISKAFSIENFW